jgi:hypothetical protein
VGAVLVVQFISLIFCGKVSRSQHLTEIEGEGFPGVDEEEVARIRMELELSKIQSMKIEGAREAVMSDDIEAIKREAKNAVVQDIESEVKAL